MLTLVDEAIEQYAIDHSSPLPPLFAELAAETRARTTLPQMMVGPIEGNFLRMLVQLTGAKRVVEVGTFTGFSALCMASALPEDGELVTCEISEEHAAIARTFFERSEHGRKIKIRMGPAVETLRHLPEASFDLMFVDADKVSYPAYYEEAMRLLKHGGLLVGDNALWSGNVLEPKDDATRGIVAFNERANRDDRVEHVLLTVRDGMHLIRKK
ncbi:O-methyltransferase [Vulgatibacter sp.]|uniref:O-methyltransferase n=1 Tax=Vulgatibacter sp. TaxID=1971226 RepID=UPI00356809E8